VGYRDRKIIQVIEFKGYNKLIPRASIESGGTPYVTRVHCVFLVKIKSILFVRGKCLGLCVMCFVRLVAKLGGCCCSCQARGGGCVVYIN